MHRDFGRGVLALEIWREQRMLLNLAQHTMFGVVGKRGQCRDHFVDHVGEVTVGMKYNMAGTRAGFHRGEGGIVRCQCSGGGVKLKNQNLVKSKIAQKSIAVIGIGHNAMGMRPAWRSGLTLEPWSRMKAVILPRAPLASR